MAVDAAERRASAVGRQVATLVFAQVRDPGGGAVRAAGWHNALLRLGLGLPLFVVHDLGLLLATGKTAELAPRRELLARVAAPPGGHAAVEAYGQLLARLAASEVIERAATWRLRDELVALLIARVVGDVVAELPGPGWGKAGGELPLGPEAYAQVDPAGALAAVDAAPLWAFLTHLGQRGWHLLAALEQIDLDTLRLLGLFSGGAGQGLDLVELSAALRSTDAADVVNFSLDLLPSVLETKRQSGAQTFAIDGYASIERQGSVDSLVLSEFATDDDLFERKVIDNELYYYGRERQRDDERRLRYVLVDASASMRGQRATFARGLALALVKKLSLAGDEIWLRFFDSRLYDLMKVGAKGQVSVPYVLSFRAERGRNYARVLRQLLLELSRVQREARRQVTVHLITHGQCHLPLELVNQLRQFARLHAVIILPSQAVSLDYLTAFDSHQIVTADALASRDHRRERALGIVKDAGDAPPPARGPRG